MHHRQSREEVVQRWQNARCQCDLDVGYWCERCHDTQVLANLIGERDRLRGGGLLRDVLEAFRKLAKDIRREWPESDSRESIEIADIVNEIARRIDAITAQLRSED